MLLRITVLFTILEVALAVSAAASSSTDSFCLKLLTKKIDLRSKFIGAARSNLKALKLDRDDQLGISMYFEDPEDFRQTLKALKDRKEIQLFVNDSRIGVLGKRNDVLRALGRAKNPWLQVIAPNPIATREIQAVVILQEGTDLDAFTEKLEKVGLRTVGPYAHGYIIQGPRALYQVAQFSEIRLSEIIDADLDKQPPGIVMWELEPKFIDKAIDLIGGPAEYVRHWKEQRDGAFHIITKSEEAKRKIEEGFKGSFEVASVQVRVASTDELDRAKRLVPIDHRVKPQDIKENVAAYDRELKIELTENIIADWIPKAQLVIKNGAYYLYQHSQLALDATKIYLKTTRGVYMHRGKPIIFRVGLPPSDLN